MPLERGVGAPIEMPGNAVLFSMNDGSKLVPCTITAEALHRAGAGAFASSLRAFAALRRTIEAAASAKYDAGAIDPDGGVTLGPEDVTRSR